MQGACRQQTDSGISALNRHSAPFVQVVAGYDTSGIRKAIQTHKWEDALDGFFLRTTDKVITISG